MDDPVERRLSSPQSTVTLTIANSIVAMSREPMLLLDEGLRVLSVNRRFLRVYKLSPDLVEDRSIYDIRNGEWRIPALRRILEGMLPLQGEINDFMLNHEFDSIGQRVMRVSVRHLKQIDESPGLIFLSVDDVTQQINADSERFEHIRLLNQMCEIAQIGAWEFDTESLAGTWTSQVARIHDLSLDQEPSVQLGLSFFSDESKPIINEAVKRAIAEGTPYDLELELISAVGKRKWVRTIGTPIKRDGNVVQVRGSMQDITERKNIEHALRESEEKISLFFKTSSAMMALCTAEDSRFVDINPSFLHLLGLSREQIIGKTPDELNLSSNRMDYSEIGRTLLREGSVHYLRATVKTQDGTPKDLVISIDEITIEGVSHWLIVANEMPTSDTLPED